MTENYLVFVEFPLVLNPMALAFAKIDSFETYIKHFKWLPKQGTRFIIVEKSTGKVVEMKSDAIFSFHHANAYEDEGRIVIDFLAHDFSKLGRVFPQSTGAEATKAGLYRFYVSLEEKSLSHERVLEKSYEFPKVPDLLDGKPYRYLYMIDVSPKAPALAKYDWKARKLSTWSSGNANIIEPIFVPAPNASREDEGVLLTVVNDSQLQISYLLVLDAENLKELARARLPEMLPETFHGQFF
jgi:carotenoid cleavage dioxygenase-like enzyme